MVLVDRPGRPGPLEQRTRIEGHTAAVLRPLHHIRHQTVRVQLRVALPAGAMPETRHHPTLRRHPPAHPLRLHPSHRSPLLQKPQRHPHRLPVSGRHRSRRRLRTQRPQQRHALRRREREIERQHRTRPTPRQQVHARERMLPVDQGPQLVGLHHPRQPQTLRPPAPPHPRRLPHPGVILVDTQRHRRNQILRIRQPRHRQHQPPPPTPSPPTPSPSTLPTATSPNSITPPTIHPSTATIQTGTDTCHPSGEALQGVLTTTPCRGRTPGGWGAAERERKVAHPRRGSRTTAGPCRGKLQPGAMTVSPATEPST